MALSLQPNFVPKVNSTLPLAQAPGTLGLFIRVASLVSDVLGTITALTPAGTVAFTLSPETPPWVTSAVDATGTIFTISFSNAVPNGTIPYEFYVTCTDGTSTIYFPIALDVKPPLSLAVFSGAFAGSTTFTIPSWDDTQPDVVIQGVGLSGQPVSGVSFIPTALPQGMEFLTTNGSELVFHLSDPTVADVPGGLQLYVNQPTSQQVTIQAYAAGFFYDEPDRAFQQTFTIQSLTSKAGTLDFIVGIDYDFTDDWYRLDLDIDFLQGQAPLEVINRIWQITGTGTKISGGGIADNYLEWEPTSTGTVTFTLTLVGATSGNVYGSKTLGPYNTQPGSGSWISTNAVKIQLDSNTNSGYAGSAPAVTVSTPAAELSAGETITVTFTFEKGSSLETTITPPASVVLSAANPTRTVPSFLIPTSTVHQKWGLKCSAASNAGSPPSRFGFAESAIVSYGPKQLLINGGNPVSLAGNTGSTITPYQLAATDVVTSLSVSGATFSLVGAPDGLFINTSNQIVGDAMFTGVFTFQVLAEYAGYANTLSGIFTLTTSQVATPLVITNPSVTGALTNPAIEINNTPFTVQWSISGLPTILNMLQSGSLAGPRNVIGATQAATSQPTTSVVAVYGSSYYGNAYSIPIIILSSSITATQQLLPSPTIGSIDQNYELTLNWQPYIVAGGYTVYQGWDIYLTTPPGGTPQLQSVNGKIPTGEEFPGWSPSNRIFETVLAAGDYTVTMTALTTNPAIAANSNPWDSPKQFPTALTTASVTLSTVTAQLGQPVTITLSPTYSGAQYWSVTYPDGTTTGFVPLSVRSFATTFAVYGPQNIIIETENDFSTSNPPVKLRRQLTLPIYITNQQYTISSSSTANLTGALGVGGTQGFEIINATENAGITPEPWEVIQRNLVRDTVTNELKLMVATSRFQSASSLLDTMAIDVFPIPGRPLSLEVIDTPAILQVTPTTSSVPVSINTTTLPTIIVGKPMVAYNLLAAGGNTPYSWYTDSTLPFGLNLSINGTLYGTPLELGTFNIDFSVEDNSVPASIASVTLPISINTDLKITTSVLSPATVNKPYSLQIVQTGGLPPYAWSVPAGSFPLGITINSKTGLLSGVPVTYNSTTDFSKTFTGTIQITDTIGAIVTAVLTMQLLPAALEFGNVDQPNIYATSQFKLVVPVFGGQSPYTLTSFTDDGIVGSGFQVVNPNTITMVAGHVPPALTLTTDPGPTNFYTPVPYPSNISFDLSDFTSGGTPPYNWTINPTANNTLQDAAIYGSYLIGNPIADGTYTVGVTVVDSIGHLTQGLFSLFVQQQNSAAVGFQVYPVAVNFNGTPTNPKNWSVLPITSPATTGSGQPNIPGSGVAIPFPDAMVSQLWTPPNVATNSGQSVYNSYTYFGLAVYQNGVLQMTQNGAPSRRWAGTTSFYLGDTIIDSKGHLEICTQGGTSGASEPTNWSVVGGQTTDNTVIWTESLQAIPGPMSFTLGIEDEEPENFPTWISYVNGTEVAGTGGYADYSGIILFNTGFTPGQPSWLEDYSFLAQFDNIVSSTNVTVLPGSPPIVLSDVYSAAKRESISVTSAGSASPYTTVVEITSTEAYHEWVASQNFTLGQQILDSNGNIQTVVTAGVTSATVQTWNKNQSGTTTDNTVIWTNDGVVGMAINLSTLPPSGLTHQWYYPLTAEGGVSPYTYQIISESPNPSTLLGSTITSLNNLPAIASNSEATGVFQLSIVATDSAGNSSSPAAINFQLTESAVLPVNILTTNLPTVLYGPPTISSGPGGELGRIIPPNTYFFEANLVSNWTTANLPAVVTLTTTPSTRAFLQGTPTVNGTFIVTVTATSVSYGTFQSHNYTIQVNPRSAVIGTPIPTQATVGLNYRAVNNNAIFSVNYIGYQPTDSDLPLLTSVTGTVGAPGSTVGGLPTTQVTNLTPNGFTMLFDYQNNIIGSDTVTLVHNSNVFGTTVTLNVVYSPLVVTGTTPPSITVSEYAILATFTPPVSIVGGNPPYSINFTGTSDPRFTPINNNSSTAALQITVAQFAPGALAQNATYPCQAQMTVTDTEGTPQTAQATGIISVFVKAETYITVQYSNQNFAAPIISNTNIYSLVIPYTSPTQYGVLVLLGHPPYTLNVTSVVLPGALVLYNGANASSANVALSPSKRVIVFNTIGSTVAINDVNGQLQPQGQFNVPTLGGTPIAGTYTIVVHYQVTDNEGITSTGSANLSVVIS